MPRIRETRSPASDSFRGRIRGIPPPTAASNDRSGVGRVRRVEEFLAVVRQELLARGDHGLAVLERPKDQRAGRLDAPDQLAHDVDLGIVDHARRVGGEHAERSSGTSRSRSTSRTATRATSKRQPVRSAMSSPCSCIRRIDGGADVAAPQQADAHDAFAHEGSGPIHVDMRISSSYPWTCGSVPRADLRPRTRTADRARSRPCSTGTRTA